MDTQIVARMKAHAVDHKNHPPVRMRTEDWAEVLLDNAEFTVENGIERQITAHKIFPGVVELGFSSAVYGEWGHERPEFIPEVGQEFVETFNTGDVEFVVESIRMVDRSDIVSAIFIRYAHRGISTFERDVSYINRQLSNGTLKLKEDTTNGID